MHEPFDHMIEKARQVGERSHCEKSKRGVVIHTRVGRLVGCGKNGMPEPFLCDGTDECKSVCRYRCVHAEARALAAARMSKHADYHDVYELDLVHVKVVDGEIVASGPPSCLPCAREILDANLHGVWLFEESPAVWCNHRSPTGEICSSVDADGEKCGMWTRTGKHTTGEWKFYPSEEFYVRTLQNQSTGIFVFGIPIPSKKIDYDKEPPR